MTADILVSDDDPLAGEAAESILVQAGYSCRLVPDARAAVAALRERRFDLLVTDIIMPDMDGIELIGAVRAHWPGLPVLAVSGGGRVGAAELLNVARVLGADDVVRKPLRAETLLPVVEGLLARGKPAGAQRSGP